jgi:uncharacterized protein YraI
VGRIDKDRQSRVAICVSRERRRPETGRRSVGRAPPTVSRVRVKERPVVSTTVRRGFAVSNRRAVRLLTAMLILAATIAPEIATPRSARAASAVTTSALNLRSGPSTDQRIRLVMPEGAEVEITGGPRHGFYKVVYDGREGWASGDYLDLSGGGGDGGGGGDSGSTAVLSALNLRSGASTSSSIILVMPEGSHVDLTGDSDNGFLGVVYRGTTGWAYAGYLDTGTSAAADGGSLPTGNGGGSATVDSALNLRSGPSTGDAIILVMPGGAGVELTGDESNGFLGVIYNGTRGWAYGQYLTTGGGGSDGSVDGSDGWSTDEIVAIIYAAAANYGQNGDDMLRVAQCESGLDPSNVTPPYSASGLFQFLPGTWASTPFANEDIFDPVANANAAAWMWSVGRRNEWVCQ